MSNSRKSGLAEQLSAARDRFATRGWLGAHARLWVAGLDGVGVPSPVDFCFGQGRGVVALLQPPHLQALGFGGVTVARCLLGTAPATVWAASMRGGAGRSAAEELEAALIAALAGHDAVVLDRYGVMVAHESWRDLERRVDAIDHAAQVTLLAQQGPAASAPAERVERLATGLAALGIRADTRCERCNACPLGQLHARGRDALSDALADAIDAHLGA